MHPREHPRHDPCSREVAPKCVVVGFLDPQVMVGLIGSAQVRAVADDAERRLRRVRASLDGQPAD